MQISARQIAGMLRCATGQLPLPVLFCFISCFIWRLQTQALVHAVFQCALGPRQNRDIKLEKKEGQGRRCAQIISFLAYNVCAFG